MRLLGPSNIAAPESGGLSSPDAKILARGEMADRIRSFAWASTALGPLESWSPELLAVVNLILSCPTPARMLWGPDLVLIYNDSYRLIPGKRHPDALGRPARDVFRDIWNVVGPLLETAFVTGEPFVLDKRRVPVETGEGVKEFYLDCTYSPIYENGKVAGLLGLFHDVTGEVNQARDLEARLNAIYNTSLEYIGLMTPEGMVIDSNRASQELAGNSRSEHAGKHFTQTPWFADSPEAAALIGRAIASANAGETFRSELSLQCSNRDPVVFDFSLSPVRDAQGAIVFLLAEGRNITEEKRIASALLKSEQLAAVGRLASSIAHEINNPLESVMNLIYLARNAGGTDAERYLDLADQEIRRVSVIANQTLRFHKQASRPQAATAADLFSTVMSIYEGRLRNAHVQVEKRFQSGKSVVCFPGDVRQVLNNLVSNALEAMAFGGRLLIRSRNGRDWKTGRQGLVLTIADNGAGIPAEARNKIFDAFFTTKGAAGNGLGLWVCQEIVQRHHGTLRVRSTQRPGRSGTAFALFLPFDSPRE